MLTLPQTTTGPAATETLGAALAPQLAPGGVVALYGELGAGKTQFIRGICTALGVDAGAVSSPTFAIVQVYDGQYRGAPLPIYHLDAYRLRDLEELVALGLDEYLYGEGVCLIEWPERFGALLPDHTLRLDLVHRGVTEREVRWRTAP
ncbi:MAG: tRNA (adenosine(37)-N6)-threonylcarbamoyltransferase complex ATPase subunit type 1 TsaE [Bacteroidota bacterium]